MKKISGHGLLDRKYKRTGLKANYDEVEFGNYKEPLRKVKGGYGYMGVLLYSKDHDMVQCHQCGLLFRSITNSHLLLHGITHDEYKEKYGLAKGTKLIGEGTREKLIECYEKGKHWMNKKAIKDPAKWNKMRTGTKIPLEVKNRRGTCPDQLLQKIKDLKAKIGRTPTKRDFRLEHKGRFLGTIYETFGSWTKAVQMAGYKPVSIVKKEKYSNERLIEYMQIFYKKHGRTPRASDMQRGLLPDAHVYEKRFGSLNDARKIAGVPLLVQCGRSGSFEYSEAIN